MSDRFYDNKGIEHLTKENAEWANHRYLNEEREAREKGLALQRQQVEITERAAREAELHRREQEEDQMEAERDRLSELQRQGASAKSDRDYKNKVLFLKESDEATRLATFVEMIGNSLNWKFCPKDAQGYNDTTWVAEHQKNLSLFYHLPELPKECQPDGTLTRKIHTLVNTPPQPPQSVGASAFLSEDGLRLTAEKDKCDEELQRLDGAEKLLMADSGLLGCLGVMGVVVLLFGTISFVWDKRSATQGEEEMPFAYSVLSIGLLLCVVAVVLRLMRSSQLKTNQGRLEALGNQKIKILKKKDDLQRRLQPFWDKASTQAEEQNRKQATAEITAKKAAEQWMAVWRAALVKSFFDQRLWIEDQFPTQLKEVLQEIQRPYPTSCRASVDNLNKTQIESTYKAVVGAILELFSSVMCRMRFAPTVNRDRKYPFSWAIQEMCDRGPTVEELRNIMTDLHHQAQLKQAMGDWKEVQRLLKKRAEQEEKLQDLQNYKRLLDEKGVFLQWDEGIKFQRQQKDMIADIIMAGPTSPSNQAPNESRLDTKEPEDKGTLFILMLVSVPADRKVAIIQALRKVKPSLSLADAVDLAGTLPSTILHGISDITAQIAAEKLEQAGAGVRIDRTS